MLTIKDVKPAGLGTLRQISLMYQNPPEKVFRIADYCPIQQAFSWLRIVEIVVPWNLDSLQLLLDKHPEAVIYKVVRHEPYLTEGMKTLSTMNMESKGLVAARQRIPDYIDDFGQYVYVCGRISWVAHPDIDERYEGVITPPHETFERDDLRNRTGTRK